MEKDKEMGKEVAFIDMDGTLLAPVFTCGNHFVTGFSDDEWIRVCHTQKNSYEYCVPVPHVVAFICRLRNAGYEPKVLSVVTSEKEENDKKRWLAEHGLNKLFSEVIFVRSDVQKIELLAALFKTQTYNAKNCLLVEDSYSNICAANILGMRTVHVSHILCGLAESIADL